MIIQYNRNGGHGFIRFSCKENPYRNSLGNQTVACNTHAGVFIFSYENEDSGEGVVYMESNICSEVLRAAPLTIRPRRKEKFLKRLLLGRVYEI